MVLTARIRLRVRLSQLQIEFQLFSTGLWFGFRENDFFAQLFLFIRKL